MKCKICGVEFQSKYRNKYGLAKLCGKPECDQENKRRASLAGYYRRAKELNAAKNSWYWDVVRKNALREKKDPTEVAQRIRRTIQITGLTRFDSKEVSRKLSAFLKNRGLRSYFPRKASKSQPT